MKIEKKNLNEALKVLGKVVSQTSPVEVQKSIRFVGDANGVTAMVTDGTEVISLAIEATAEYEIDFCVPFKDLKDMIRFERSELLDIDGTYLDYWEFINEDKIDIIQERSVAGIISLEFTHHIAIQITQKYNLPLVCINNASNHIDNVYSVNSDAESALRLSFNCLYEHGHKNIAFIAYGNSSFAGQKRLIAFEKIINEYKLQDSCIIIQNNVNNYHGIILDLYKRGITGIISDGESAGLMIWNSLNFCNIEVPKQMSLITWEMPHVSNRVNPAVTTVQQNFDMIAKKAVHLLKIQLKKEQIKEDIYVPYLLHMRDTVSIPREI